MVTVTFKHMRKDWCALHCMSRSCSWKIWAPFLISSFPFSFNWAIDISETVIAEQVLQFWAVDSTVLYLNERRVTFMRTSLKHDLPGFAFVDLCAIFSCRGDTNPCWGVLSCENTEKLIHPIAEDIPSSVQQGLLMFVAPTLLFNNLWNVYF